MLTSYTQGIRGEQLVVDFLRNQSFQIVDRRFKTRYGEIDVIAADYIKNLLLFVEIKTRKRYSTAVKNMELITNRQILRNCSAASYFFCCSEGEKYINYQMRFDFVVTDGDSIIKYVKNAWEFTEINA